MIEKMQIKFGMMVRRARLHTGMTQERAAEVINTCCINIRKIEKGKGNISIRTWIMLCITFNISINSLQREFIRPYILERLKATNIDVFLDFSEE